VARTTSQATSRGPALVGGKVPLEEALDAPAAGHDGDPEADAVESARREAFARMGAMSTGSKSIPVRGHRAVHPLVSSSFAGGKSDHIERSNHLQNSVIRL
jgi:hypothetical protein